MMLLLATSMLPPAFKKMLAVTGPPLVKNPERVIPLPFTCTKFSFVMLVKVPENRVTLAVSTTVTVPPTKVKHPEPHELKVPVVIVIVPKSLPQLPPDPQLIPVRFIVALSVVLRLNVAVPAPELPPPAKSILVASAAVGSASAKRTNKTTRLICAPPLFLGYNFGAKGLTPLCGDLTARSQSPDEVKMTEYSFHSACGLPK
jgi:hypothetical protein